MMFLGPNQWSVPARYMKLRKGYSPYSLVYSDYFPLHLVVAGQLP